MSKDLQAWPGPGTSGDNLTDRYLSGNDHQPPAGSSGRQEISNKENKPRYLKQLVRELQRGRQERKEITEHYKPMSEEAKNILIRVRMKLVVYTLFFICLNALVTIGCIMFGVEYGLREYLLTVSLLLLTLVAGFSFYHGYVKND